MAKRHRSFEAKTSKTSVVKADDKITFDVGDETFECRQQINGVLVLKFAAASSGDGGEAAAAMFKFFDDVLIPADVERFKATIERPDLLIEMDEFTDILGWVMEQYTAERPTEPSGE